MFDPRSTVESWPPAHDVPPSEDSRDELEALRAELASLRIEYATLRKAHARCGEREAVRTREQAALSATVAEFARYAERELARVRARTTELDNAIDTLRRSRVWTLKTLLGRLRR